MTETIARLRITLCDTDPEVWRTIEASVEASLKMIRDAIQAAMGWQDYHLWEFEVGTRRYGLPDREWPDDTLSAAKNIKLAALIDRGIRQFDYIYDMGDKLASHHYRRVRRAWRPRHQIPALCRRRTTRPARRCRRNAGVRELPRRDCRSGPPRPCRTYRIV